MLIRFINKKSTYYILEDIFLITVGIYLSFLVYNSAPLWLDISDTAEQTLFTTLTIMAGVKLIAALLSCDCKDRKKQSLYVIFALIAALVFFFSYESTGYTFLSFLPLITLGMIGTDYRKATRFCTFFLALSVVIIIVLGITGVIPNLVYLREGVIRSAWGYGFPTDFASYIVFICVLAWIGWDKVSDWFFMILGFISLQISFYVANSRTSTVCSALFILLVFAHMLSESETISENKFFKKMVRGKIGLVFRWIITLSFPIFTVFFFSTMYLYSKGIPVAYKLNYIMSNRVKLSLEAFSEHGLTLFGTAFDQIGAGGTTFANEGYNFIDSSYTLILLRYGILVLIVMALYWVAMTWKGIKINDWRLALGLSLIAFHSISEHHFPEFNYNILLVIPFAVLGSGTDDRHKVIEHSLSGRKLSRMWIFAIYSLTVILFFIGFYMLIPRVLSQFRTWADITHLVEFEAYGMKLICEATGIVLLIIVAFIIAVFRLEGCFIYNRKGTKCCLIIIALSIIAFIGACVFTERVITRPDNDKSEVLMKDDEAVRVAGEALEISGGKLYSNILPELYSRKYGFFSKSLFDGEELARYDKTTVIMNSDEESIVFLGKGFLYADISEEHAMYSNDEVVIKALEDAGYHFTGYYAKEKTVDYSVHQVEALRSGTYTVHYELSIPKDSETMNVSDDTIVCSIYVNKEWDSDPIKFERLTRARFGKDGTCEAELKCYIPEGRAIGIRMYRMYGNEVVIDKITFRKTPDYDVHRTYDEKGRRIKEVYFTNEGEPYEMTDGYFACEFGYDSDGNESSYLYLDSDGNPMVIKKGYAGLKKKYNYKKQVTREDYIGTDGNHIMLTGGYSAIEYKYDEAGNQTEISYFDDRTPVMIKENYSKSIRAYDEDNRLIHEELYDTEGTPVLNSSGYASIDYEYDEDGNETCRKTYGTAGEPVICTSGYAVLEREYNENSKVIREKYYGTDGKPLTLSSGYAALEYTYDDYGNRTDTHYINASGWECMLWNQFSTEHIDYNGKNQAVKEEYFDTMHRLVLNPEGYICVLREYDEKGRNTLITYADKDEHPVNISARYAMIKRTYNDNNQLIHEDYCDAKGNLTFTDLGFASIEYGYDDAGNQTDVYYLDTDGDFVEITKLYAKIHRDFNEFGQLIKEEYYDKKDKKVLCIGGYACLTREYNILGQLRKEAYFDRKGNAVLCAGGYASSEKNYDSSGNLISEKYYDVNGKIVINSFSYAELRKTYDEGKRVLEESYYGREGAPINCKDGFSVIKYEYDKNGNRTKTSYYNTHGKLVPGKDGYARVVKIYDAKNHMIKEEYYDTDGKLFVFQAGYSIVEHEYDIYGNQILTAFYDDKGKPCYDWGLYNRVSKKYNEYHQSIRDTYQDEDGEILFRGDGFAIVERRYDDQGYLTEQRFLDKSEKLSLYKDGYSIFRREYDDKHCLIRESYFGTDDKPINIKAGYAVIEMDYDEKGNVTETRYLDVDGNLVK